MRVTLGTAHSQPHPNLHCGVRSVLDGSDAKFLIVCASLVVFHRVAVESGCQNLFGRRLGQEVTSELFDRELVVWQIAVERLDHPIAVAPHVAVAIFLVTFRVRKACQVEPHPCPMFTEILSPQQAIDHGFEIARLHKGIRVLNCRRQTSEVKRHPADQCVTICLVCRCKPGCLFQLLTDKMIDRMPVLRHGSLDGWFKGPVRIVFPP